MKTDMTTKEISEEAKKLFDVANELGLNVKPKYNSLEEFEKDFFSAEPIEL